MRHILPAIDKCLSFQTFNFDLIFSNTGNQKSFLLRFPPTCKPKYLKGIPIWLQFNVLAKVVDNLLSTPKVVVCDLWKLILIPKASSWHLSITLIVNTFWKVASHIRSVSFANCSIQVSTSSHHILSPCSTFSLIACLTNPFKPSTTIRKRNGASGSPCLNPLDDLNSDVRLPLTNTKIDVDSTQPLIQQIHFSLNPYLFNIWYKNSHLTESYAFS